MNSRNQRDALKEVLNMDNVFKNASKKLGFMTGSDNVVKIAAELAKRGCSFTAAGQNPNTVK